MTRRIVFKCAFGDKEGWGHVVRSSALASEFRTRGWETCLWTGGDRSRLPEDVATSFGGTLANEETMADILLVDEMYTAQTTLEKIAATWRGRNTGGIVAGVDDMQRRSMMGFDFALNTEIGLRKANYAAGISLLGERYALLRSGFRSPADLGDLSDFEGHVPVLVMLGGTDAFGCLPPVLEELSGIDWVSIAPVVLGSSEVDLSAFSAGRALKGVGSAEMAAWMRFCSMGILGCGSSVYEAAAMELPFMGLSLVDNQTATARKVEQHWQLPVRFLEIRRKGDLGMGSQLSHLLQRKRRAYSEVDTQGAARVADALEVLLAERRSG